MLPVDRRADFVEPFAEAADERLRDRPSPLHPFDVRADRETHETFELKEPLADGLDAGLLLEE